MNTASPPTELTRDQFLAGVRASGVLTERQLEVVHQALTPFQKSAREVADFLVEHHALTRFQAERLLQNKTEGFLLGPYVVLDYLGGTTTGRAYKAIHRTMNRAVAVLVLRTDLTATEEVREAIRAQARSAARLAHPNLLTLLDVNTAGGRMYLVHEYVDGTDAGSLVRKDGPLGVMRAGEFARQIAVGLQHAHDKQIPHGRLCPAVVRIGRPGGNGPQDKPVVKVAGSGLGVFAGVEASAEYTAPELAASSTPTPAADLFALGGVLHFLLTGRPPNTATPMRMLRRDLPAPLIAVVESLLSPNPAHRPATATDAANALAAFATDDSAFIDFSLPANNGSPSAGTLPTSATSPDPNLPVGIPLPVAPPILTPTPVRSPFADLHLDDEDSDVSNETPVNGQAVYTPLHTTRRPRPTKRRGTRARQQDHMLSLWLGVIAAVVVLAMAGAALAVLVTVMKG